jgi:hypothetical protein
MSQPINELWRRVFRGGEYRQHGGLVAGTVITPSAAEGALTIFAQYRETADTARSE